MSSISRALKYSDFASILRLEFTKKMKRNKEEKDEVSVKYAKIEKRITKLDLPLELVSEITGWLPPRLVVTVYSLVNKEWREAILNYSKLDFSMSTVEWFRFCQRPQEIATAINQLSIDYRLLFKRPMFADVRLYKPDLSAISGMKRLESLSLLGVSMDKSAVKLILSVKSIKRARLCRCRLSWLDLGEFASCQFTLSVEECDLRSGDTEAQEHDSVEEFDQESVAIHVQEWARIISSIDNLERLDYTPLDKLDSNQEAEIFYKSLFSRKNLSSVALFLNSQNSKYFSLLRNITELKITNQRLHMDDVPDLSGLIQLKKLTVGPFLNGPRTAECRKKSCLGAVFKQLTGLDMGRGVLTKDEWNNLDRLDCLSELSIRGMTLGKTWKRPSIGLTQLSLSKCSIIGEDILRSVTSLPNLTSLSIARVNVDPGTDRRFRFPDLCYNDGSATKCDLIHLVHLSIEIPRNGSSSLCVLRDMPNLEKATFLRCDDKLDESCFEHIVSSKSIKELCLGNSGITAEHMKHISVMENLTSLSMGDYRINEEIARCISVMGNLRTLDLHSSRIDINAFAIIASMKSLTTLRLETGDYQTEEDVSLYITHLVSMTSLKNLRLSIFSQNRETIQERLEGAKYFESIELR